jgi:hypothetical protein
LLEIKEAQKRKRHSSNTSTGFIVWEGTLQNRISAKELEPQPLTDLE